MALFFSLPLYICILSWSTLLSTVDNVTLDLDCDSQCWFGLEDSPEHSYNKMYPTPVFQRYLLGRVRPPEAQKNSASCKL